MLLASWLGDQIGSGFGWLILAVAIAIHYGKKANPEVKEKATKAAASTAIRLLGRIFKK